MNDNVSAYSDLNGNSEIPLPQIFNLLTDSWKSLAVDPPVGARVGLSGCFILGVFC